MTDLRNVAVSAEQAKILDEVVVPGLMRANDDRRASQMMALALAYRFAKTQESTLPDNVRPIRGNPESLRV